MNKRDGKKFINRVLVLAAENLGLDFENDRTETLGKVAKAIGTSRPTLYHWLKRTQPGMIPVAKAVALANLARVDIQEFAD